MRKTLLLAIGILMLVVISGAGGPGVAWGDEVALVVHLRGKAYVERTQRTEPGESAGPERFEAAVRSPIELRDVIETLERSRAKMLFEDESVMTLGPQSRASVEEFVAGVEGIPGTTVFGLMDGKMRTVVGRTSFEVHTPTVVAAARGTVIEFTVGTLKNGKSYTTVTCLEGTVVLTGVGKAAGKTLTLSAGQSVTIKEGQDPSRLTPVPSALKKPPGGGTQMVTSIETEAIDSILTPSVVITPPVDITPAVAVTPVIVDVIFPGDNEPR